MKDFKFLVYAAGPISYCSWDQANDWREYMSRALEEDGIYIVSPLRGKDYLKDSEERNSLLPTATNKYILSTERGILYRDMFDVRRCDLIYANLYGTKKPSIGTAMEIGAAWILNKPIVLYMDKDNMKNPHNHAMINQSSGWITDDFDESICLIRAVLLPE
jgi:nucleoside 2-deoxyribosyltransferase